LRQEQIYWLEQAADMEKLIRVRYDAIHEQLVQEDLEYCRHRAAIMEEWKDKVEEQRQGLERQVGEIERNRQKLEQQVQELQAELGRSHRSKGKFSAALRKLGALLLPPNSRRRKLASKVWHVFHK